MNGALTNGSPRLSSEPSRDPAPIEPSSCLHRSSDMSKLQHDAITVDQLGLMSKQRLKANHGRVRFELRPPVRKPKLQRSVLTEGRTSGARARQYISGGAQPKISRHTDAIGTYEGITKRRTRRRRPGNGRIEQPMAEGDPLSQSDI